MFPAVQAQDIRSTQQHSVHTLAELSVILFKLIHLLAHRPFFSIPHCFIQARDYKAHSYATEMLNKMRFFNSGFFFHLLQMKFCKKFSNFWQQLLLKINNKTINNYNC